ncbi:MAG: Na/Pi cotransporter family protein [Eubacteriales bacterium]
MTIFDALNLLGGLVLFLFGMNVMGTALEKRAGNRLKTILGSMTSNVFKGFMLGLGVTAIIQSSSATTVMVVGFVNSGLMTLHQAVGVIMGANLGTSVTSWLLSTTGISGESMLMQLLKPSSFTPVLAAIGLFFYMFQKNAKKKDVGMILLGFAVLMFGMDTMSASVSGLQDVPEFRRILTLFSNPFLGVAVGTIFTAIIQSSSASVGILQALTTTGSITYATAIPIVMGQNIGTCVSAMISSIGASKNAKRAAVIHLLFNLMATLILLPLYYLLDMLLQFPFAGEAVNPLGIAVVHTTFKILALAILMPASGLLEKLACRLVPDSKKDEEARLLDERLLATPSVAIERCRSVAVTMAEQAVSSMRDSMTELSSFDAKLGEAIRASEEKVDVYEDELGTYLVKLSSHEMTESDSAEANELLHLIGDFERISDHAVNLLESAEEIHDKQLSFSAEAKRELSVMVGAVTEILDLALTAFRERNLDSAFMVEPLEQVVDSLRDYIKKQHVSRLQHQECTIEMGFVLSDVLTNLERVSDHCSNIAGCLLEMSHESMDMHKYLRSVKDGGEKEYNDYFDYFKMKYAIE